MKWTARYILIDGIFKEHVFFEIQNNRIQLTDDGQGAVDLGKVAILPGCVNAHSHAFQRVIRGRTEHRNTAFANDNFWSWRNAMYSAAQSLTADEISTVAEFTFLEMAQNGITSVGEFHYLHNQPDGRPYLNPNELADRMIEAAKKIGIRIALLNVAYHFGGIDSEPSLAQQRFVSTDVESYLEKTNTLRTNWKGHDVVIGYAPHSVRAVDENWLRTINEASEKFDSPLHIHASEQRSEVADSIKKRGTSPIEWLYKNGALSERTTIVHANHATQKEIEYMAKRKTSICVCPTTERNLGDGFLPIVDFLKFDIPICLGSDSHTQIDLFSDARLLEYNERLRVQKRNHLASELEKKTTSEILLPMLAENGSRSLGIGAAAIANNELADFFTVDLNHRTLLGSDPLSLGANILLSMSPDAVKDVFVGGDRIVKNGKHVYETEIYEKYETLMERVGGSYER